MSQELRQAIRARLERARIIHERLELDIMEAKVAEPVIARNYYIACGKASMVMDEIEFLVELLDL